MYGKITVPDGTSTDYDLGSAGDPFSQTSLGFQLFGKYPVADGTSGTLGEATICGSTRLLIKGIVLAGANYNLPLSGGLYLKADAIFRFGLPRKMATESAKQYGGRWHNHYCRYRGCAQDRFGIRVLLIPASANPA